MFIWMGWIEWEHLMEHGMAHALHYVPFLDHSLRSFDILDGYRDYFASLLRPDGR